MFALLVYLVLRVGKTDVETVIQTSLAILASTLFIVVSPLHKMFFNNHSICEAMTGWMSLDEDTVLNITLLGERRDVGEGLIRTGNMKLLSRTASYASPYSSSGGLDPGPTSLGLLTLHESHLLVVDQDGQLVLLYGDGNAVRLQIEKRDERQILTAEQQTERRDGRQKLTAEQYSDHRYWHVIKVTGLAGRCLVH